MRRFKNDTRGVVTVFVTLLLIPCIALFGMLTDVTRIYAATQMLQDATDNAADAMLASYNNQLKDMYGLFAVDLEEVKRKEETAKMYLEATFDINKAFTQDLDIDGYFNLYGITLDTIQFFNDERGLEEGGVHPEAYSLSNPLILKKQILDFGKYRLPIELAATLFEGTDRKGLESQSKELQEDTDIAEEYERITNEIGDDLEELYKELYRSMLEYDGAIEDTRIGRGWLPDKKLKGAIGDLERELKTIQRRVTSSLNRIDKLNDELDEILNQNAVSLKRYEEVKKNIEDEYELIEKRIEDGIANIEAIELELISEKNEIIENIDKVNDKLDEIIARFDPLKLKIEKLLEERGIALPDGSEEETDDMLLNILIEIEEYNESKIGVGVQEELEKLTPQIEKAFQQLVKDKVDALRQIENVESNSLRKTIEDICQITTQEDNTVKRIRTLGSQSELSELYQKLYQMFGDDDRPKLRKIINTLNDVVKEMVEADPEDGPNLDQSISREVYSQLTTIQTGWRTRAFSLGQLDDQGSVQDEGTNFLKILSDGIVGMINNTINRLYIITYASSMFSCYTTEKGSTTLTGVELNEANNYFLNGELEYIYNVNNIALLNGPVNMKANFRRVKTSMYGLRWALNYMYALKCKEINGYIKPAAKTISTATGGLLPPPVVRELLRGAVVSAETAIDMSILIDGGKVPFIKKSPSDWTLNTETLLTLIHKLTEKVENMESELKEHLLREITGIDKNKKEKGMSYKDYLVLMIALFRSEETILIGIANLIEINMNHILGGNQPLSMKYFDLAQAYSYMRLETTATMKYIFMPMPFVNQFITGEKPDNGYKLKYETLRGY